MSDSGLVETDDDIPESAVLLPFLVVGIYDDRDIELFVCDDAVLALLPEVLARLVLRLGSCTPEEPPKPFSGLSHFKFLIVANDVSSSLPFISLP